MVVSRYNRCHKYFHSEHPKDGADSMYKRYNDYNITVSNIKLGMILLELFYDYKSINKIRILIVFSAQVLTYKPASPDTAVDYSVVQTQRQFSFPISLPKIQLNFLTLE